MDSRRWSEWLAAQAERMGPHLTRTRDYLLANAEVRPGDCLLDLGAGRGLIALAAAERVGDGGRVIACDLDCECLVELRRAVGAATVAARVSVVQADIARLPIRDQSVDVATTRSVLAFVADRLGALREAFRVLRPGGRISCFESVNRYLTRHHETVDLRPLGDLGDRIRDLFESVYSDPAEPMLAFDERDLVATFEQAGFEEIGMNFVLRWHRQQLSREDARRRLTERGAANRPTVLELVGECLGAAAAQRYLQHYLEMAPSRPLSARSASLFIWARKPTG